MNTATPEVSPSASAGTDPRTRETVSALGAPGLLLILAAPLLRPNLLGEKLAPVGLLLALMAAIFELLRRRRRPVCDPPARILYVLPICLALADVWKLVRFSVTRPEDNYTVVQDLIITVGVVIAVIIVCRCKDRRVALARAFVLLVSVLSTSYVITALMWAVGGPGFGAYAAMQLPTGGLGAQTVFFPFTITQQSQSVLGHNVPRFVGLGREPGWMAMYCAVAYFMCPLVHLRSKWRKRFLLVAMVGCWSTAGFGVFIGVWTYDMFIRTRPGASRSASIRRKSGGLVLLGVAVWVAVSAPVLGLAAKQTDSAISVQDRLGSAQSGIRALAESPLWGLGPSTEQTGVNLIADIQASGLPFVVLVTLALLLPAVMQGRAEQGHAVPLVIFLTVLASQPPATSTWIYVLGVLSYGCRDLVRVPYGRAGSGSALPFPTPEARSAGSGRLPRPGAVVS